MMTPLHQISWQIAKKLRRKSHGEIFGLNVTAVNQIVVRKSSSVVDELMHRPRRCFSTPKDAEVMKYEPCIFSCCSIKTSPASRARDDVNTVTPTCEEDLFLSGCGPCSGTTTLNTRPTPTGVFLQCGCSLSPLCL